MDTNRRPSALPNPSWEDEPDEDPIIAELDTYRAEYAAQFDYDLDRIGEDIKAQEALNQAFLIKKNERI